MKNILRGEKMKKLLFVILACSFVVSNSFAMSTDEKTKEVSAKDWQEYQKYKKDESKKVKVSDKEYEDFQKYLENKKSTEKKNTEKNNEKTLQENTATSKTTKSNKENEIIIKGGKILTSSVKLELKNSYNGAKVKEDDTNSDGWAIRADYIRYIAENTGIGLGVAYHSEFKANDISFLNTDILLKQRFPLAKENINLYLLGGLGYGHLVGSTKYSNEFFFYEYKGGFHWTIAFGVDINSLIFDLSYSCNYIDIDTNTSYISGDGSFCSLVLSVGYKFDF